jgi:hypothetical protein
MPKQLEVTQGLEMQTRLAVVPWLTMPIPRVNWIATILVSVRVKPLTSIFSFLQTLVVMPTTVFLETLTVDRVMAGDLVATLPQVTAVPLGVGPSIILAVSLRALVVPVGSFLPGLFFVADRNTDTPGSGGTSGTGDATAGDAKRKRALDPQTAGGNARTGDSGSTSTGSVFNEAESDGAIENNNASTLT